MLPERTVKPERTGWRDVELSRRHRQWGFDLPAVDIDHLILEYDGGKVAALIEYKHEYAAPQCSTHPTYQALIDLANRAEIPMLAVRYANDYLWWRVIPLNGKAFRWVPERVKLTERQFVTFLYRIRGYEPPATVFQPCLF